MDGLIDGWMNKMKECQNAWLNHNKGKNFVASNKKLKKYLRKKAAKKLNEL